MLKASFQFTLALGKTLPVYILPHIPTHLHPKLQHCKKFTDYIARISTPQKGVEVTQIEILGVEMFGERVGFISLKAMTFKDGFSLPNYVFLRGPAVAILMLVNNKLLVVEQYRVPVQQTVTEAPAGMLDENGDFVGQAAKQIEQQTSIKIQRDQLIPLGSFYPSVGGCDEEIFMYFCRVEIGEEKLKEIEGRVHGEGAFERIMVKVMEYEHERILATKDSKLICMVFAYQNYMRKVGKKGNAI